MSSIRDRVLAKQGLVKPVVGPVEVLPEAPSPISKTQAKKAAKAALAAEQAEAAKLAKAAKADKPPTPSQRPRRTPEEKRAHWIAQGMQRGRLPDGAGYVLHFDADTVRWHGILTVPSVGVFERRGVDLIPLVFALDDDYRARAKAIEEEKAQLSGD